MPLDATRVCQSCHGTRLRALRPGIGRVAEEIEGIMGRGVTVSRVDADTDVGVGDEADIGVGTEAVLHRAAARERARSEPRSCGSVVFLEFDQELLAPRCVPPNRHCGCSCVRLGCSAHASRAV